ncbi:MAG: DUF2330 domain-containing protein [Theionarchaea archaeon]|nr:DUF2330 domain-containing protein [Theionarchaea archaeon]
MKLALVLLFILGLLFTPVLANKGSMVIGPEHISVEETGQKAIVAWNGTEEVIILSTDMKSSQSAVVLEVIPLPSNPAVTQGNSQSFVTLTQLLNEKTKKRGDKYGEGVEITFHQKIGAHDVTVVKVSDVNDFLEWITQFTQDKGLSNIDISTDFKQVVSSYLEREITYFVFDVIEVNQSVRSIQPLVYQFESSYLYYPLEITAFSDVGASFSEVTLFLITGSINVQSIVEHYPEMVFSEPVVCTGGELHQVSPEIGNLFGGSAVVITASYAGPLDGLTNDIVYPEYSELGQKELPGAESIAGALALGEEPQGHAKIIVILWIVILLLVLVAYNRSP